MKTFEFPVSRSVDVISYPAIAIRVTAANVSKKFRTAMLFPRKFFRNGGKYSLYDILDSDNNGYADAGRDLPFNEETLTIAFSSGVL